nr:MAG TPA: hypothetical protein [Microviridae sp.]
MSETQKGLKDRIFLTEPDSSPQRGPPSRADLIFYRTRTQKRTCTYVK